MQALLPGDLISCPDADKGDISSNVIIILWRDPGEDTGWAEAGVMHPGDVGQVISVIPPEDPMISTLEWYLILAPRGFGYASSRTGLIFVSHGGDR